MFSRSHYRILSTRYSFRVNLAHHSEELRSHSRVVALLPSTERVLGSVHDWHVVILSTVAPYCRACRYSNRSANLRRTLCFRPRARARHSHRDGSLTQIKVILSSGWKIQLGPVQINHNSAAPA